MRRLHLQTVAPGQAVAVDSDTRHPDFHARRLHAPRGSPHGDPHPYLKATCQKSSCDSPKSKNGSSKFVAVAGNSLPSAIPPRTLSCKLLPAWQMLKQERGKQKAAAQNCQYVHAECACHPDCRCRPQRCCRGETGNSCVALENHAGTDKPNARDNLRRYTGWIASAMGRYEAEGTCPH